jgi:hypothetical protein
MSRLAAISDESGACAAYTYLGAGKIVIEDYQVPDIKLDYKGTGNSFSGLDRFGRVVDQFWYNYGSAQPIDEYAYSYDRAGNVEARYNLLNSDLTYYYEYDALDRLTAWYDVELNLLKSWDLDSLGNDLSAGTYNAANEETPDQGFSGYDAAGNMNLKRCQEPTKKVSGTVFKALGHICPKIRWKFGGHNT